MLAYSSVSLASVGFSGWTHVLNLVLVEIRDPVDDHPGKTPAEVDDLVQDEAHDAGGEGIVLHP